MANAINDFLSNLAKQNEVARTDKFDVQITPPAAIASAAGISSSDALQGLSLQCEVSELPGREITVIDARKYGNFIEWIPHMNTYQPITFTFIVTNTMWEKKLFDAWLDYLVPAQTGLINYALDGGGQPTYEADIICTQYDQTGNAVYAVTLMGAMPTSVGQLQQNWATPDVHRLSVTFQFKKWTSTAISGGSGLSNSTSPVSTDPSAPSASTG